jgi:DNA repair exonuclease SbcCD ATPase subunit
MRVACLRAAALPRGLAPPRGRPRSLRRPPLSARAAFGKGKDVGKRLKDETVGGAVGGAVLGGLLLGPFGAVLGGQFGANLGSDRKRARQADAALRKQGITPEMVRMVEECAEGLKGAEEALRTAKDSFRLTLEEAAELDAEASELYNMASAAVQSGDDDTARTYLTKRKTVQTKLEDAKRRATEAKARVARVEASVETLSSQAKKLESILKENMAAAAERNASEAAAKFEGAGESLGSAADLEAMFEDPLEKKFRDLEGR